MSFKKLNIKIFIENFSFGEHIISYENKIEYFEVTDLKPSLLDLIPSKYRSEFHASVMHIHQPIGPHTDSDIKCTINCYIKTGNYNTIFYEIVDNNPSLCITHHQQTTGKCYEYQALKIINSFKAESGDVYLLDTDSVHSVEAIENSQPEERLAIALQTNSFSFSEVLEMLKEQGFV